MADTKTQNPSAEQRSVSRRQETSPASDFFNYGPFAAMRRLTDEVERAFSGGLGMYRPIWGERGSWMPAIDVRKNNGQFEISAELPGLNKDDVKIECTDEGVILQGEKRRQEETEEGGFHRSERSYGRFYRFIPLPEGAQAEQAKAEFKNGILRVTMPVNEQQKSKSRPIPISS